MASNLGTGNAADFNRANMKPDSGDQADALWAQNTSDNIAHLFWAKERKAFDCQAWLGDSDGGYVPRDVRVQRSFWRKLPFHDNISGTIYLKLNASGTASFKLDGTQIIGTYQTVDNSDGAIYTFTWGQTHLTDGDVYQAEGSLSRTVYGDNDYSEYAWSAWSGTTLTVY